MKRKFLSYLLVLVLMFQIMPTNAIALDNSIIADGICGENLTWTLNDKGELVISGAGAMASYSSGSAPWYGLSDNIKTVEIENDVTSIGNYAFYNCTGLTSVTIGSGVTSIGSGAFWLCTGLTEITIPDSVVSIGNKAFEDCTGLTSVTIPDSVTSIGSRAFYNCTGLTSVTIPDSVTSIGYYAFYDCTGLTQINYNAKAANDLYSSYVFYNAGTSGSGINVVFGDSVERIPADLFYVSNSSYSSKITSVTIGSGVTSIGSGAFYNCTGLTDVYYGSTVPAWKMISIGSNNTPLTSAMIHYAEPTGRIAASGKCGDNLTWTLNDKGELVISGAGAMASYSFGRAPWFPAASTIQSVTIGENVTSIGDSAFYNCTGLTQINYNAKAANDLTSSSSVFRDAGKSGSGINVVFDDSVEKIPAYLFYVSDDSSYSPKITSVTIGGGVTSIGNYAFYYCAGLTSVTIPDSVTSIGSRAFYNCTGLTEITISENVTSIGDSAFSHCMGLTQINYNAKAANDLTSSSGAFYNAGISGSGINVTFGDSVEKIPAYLFGNCTELTSVTISGGVTSIGDCAFSGCTTLTQINYNAKAANDLTSSSNVFYNAGKSGSGINVVFGDSVEKIPAYLFYVSNSSYSPKITSVTIGGGVTSIGNCAFYYCTGFTEITIPENVTSIGDSAFSYCTRLESVTIGGGVTSIGSHAFYNCKGLTSVTIPDSVTSIGSRAFYNCTGLTSVTIGGGVTSIGNYAFYDCTGLTQINYNAKAANDLTSSSDVFWDAGISGSGINVVFGDSVEKIPAYLFYLSNSSYSSKVTSVTIGKNVTSIGNYAFYYCTELTSVTIGGGVTSIGNCAFYNCTGLTQINYNAKAANDLTYSSDAFYNAGTSGSGINVVFGDSVEKIPAYLFYYKPKISKVVFCGNAPTVGENSFVSISTTAYYPYGNETWTEENRIYRYGSGYFEWKSYSDTEIESCECNILKGNYILGEGLNTAGITFTITHVDGCVENYDYSSGEITLGEYNMTTAGWQTIVVMCKGEKAKLKIYIHDAKTVILDSANYPESSHNYDNNLDKTYLYSVPEAAMLKVTFSASTMVETNVDYIYINGIQYTGNELADKTVEISGNTLEIRLVSDSTDTEYGFSIVKIEALIVEYGDYAKHKLTKHEKVEPTVDSEGNIEYWTCDECGKYFSDEEGKNEINADDIVIGKLTIKKLTYLDGEVLIEVPSNAIPENAEFAVAKIVPPPAEIVEKVKDTYGESSEVLAYYEIRLFDKSGDRIYKLDSEITIKSILPEKYQTGYIIKICQEDDDGNLVEMQSWREGEYICYKTNWLEKY